MGRNPMMIMDPNPTPIIISVDPRPVSGVEVSSDIDVIRFDCDFDD